MNPKPKKILSAILPGLIVAGLIFSIKNKKVFPRKRDQLLKKLNLISPSSMSNMSNFDSLSSNQNEDNSIITTSQSKSLKFSSFKFSNFWMLKWVVKLSELSNFTFDLFLNFVRKSSQFLFSLRMKKAFEHTYLDFSCFLNRFLAFSNGIQDDFRSASVILSSNSLRKEGLKDSMSSIVSSNSNLTSRESFQLEASAKEINPSNFSNKSFGISGLLNPPAKDFGFHKILNFLSRTLNNLINSSFNNSFGSGATRSFDRDKILGNGFALAIQNNDNKIENLRQAKDLNKVSKNIL